MSEQSVVIFDLETAPDLTVGRAVINAQSGETDAEVRTRLGEKYARAGQDPLLAFVKVPLQRIICIGAIYAHRQGRGSPWTIARSGVGHIGLRTEAQLIAGFVDSLDVPPLPQLIGFNSSSFDLPVLRYRAFALSVPVPSLHRANGKDYWYRFGRDHIDLCDVMSNFGASTKPSLNELAALCGIPGKDTDVDGSQVEAMVNANRLEDVADYCESDVVITYLLYLRFALISGELGGEAYYKSLQHLRIFIEGRIGKRPHLSKYLAAMPTSGASVNPGLDNLQN